ncbi:thiamine biosynthesis lipoprotein [Paucibacter oligotrophus]|uniref:FAD:protein FMN transferase n=1 Tax=Roseateles oligotrophus TaxID=1769250 RepID=A0A840L840_9BURK|nr:FAD:protein FMN transferase [Roseateles oligotrophus]MBB4844236.1 thiamine biosynthesis lipoprotein [Roseateles oligotrophus]
MSPTLLRRARPLLGTLLEIALPEQAVPVQFEAGFAAVQAVQACLSRFEAGSDIARFNALPAGHSLVLAPLSARLLRAAALLQLASEGRFDISQGTGPQAWRLQGRRLHKLGDTVRLDLGGIAKGFAVDRAVAALRRAGCALGSVNAGGDLRVFGALSLRLQLRDEETGGVREFGQLAEGSFATSYFAAHSRSAAYPAAAAQAGHVSVAAPRCLWADALTKLVACSGNPQHPLLLRFGARAFLHTQFSA